MKKNGTTQCNKQSAKVLIILLWPYSEPSFLCSPFPLHRLFRFTQITSYRITEAEQQTHVVAHSFSLEHGRISNGRKRKPTCYIMPCRDLRDQQCFSNSRSIKNVLKKPLSLPCFFSRTYSYLFLIYLFFDTGKIW